MKNTKVKIVKVKSKFDKKTAKPNENQSAATVPSDSAKASSAASVKRPKFYGVKTIAKSMGLKSTLVTNNRIIVTSFVESKMNSDNKSSNVEKITDFTGSNVYGGSQHMFVTDVSAKEINISTTKVSTKFCNPAAKLIGMDYIQAKDQIEQKYFGSTFACDNVHMQIAHNIMDIKKILSSCVNNIIYMFYNLNRSGEIDSVQEMYDLIGTLTSYESFDKLSSAKKDSIRKLLDSLEVYSNYFGVLFTNAKEVASKKKKDWKKLSAEEKEKYKELARKENYKILQLLSYARQMVFHDEYDIAKNTKISSEASIFNIKNAIADEALLKKLDEIYGKAIKKLNSSFVKNAQKNCFILSKVYPKCTRSEIIKMYYDFSIYKDSQILGVNVKKLREIMFDKYVLETKDDHMNNYRSRFYTLTNLLILNTLKNTTALEDFVNELRQCGTQNDKNGVVREDAKVAIYEKYADFVWKTVSGNVKKLMTFCEKYNDEKKVNFSVTKSDIESYAISSDNVDDFVKMMFFIANFLDGKEINILLCALINKFDNIADILETLKQSNSPLTFAEDYKFFEQSRKISTDIRIVKNVGRMKGELDVTKAMVMDAMVMLNTSDTALPKFRQLVYHELPDGKVDENNKDNSLRNFIINNVIKTKWFFYVAKYCNLKECAKIMQNVAIVKFVLKDIPEKQIDRYYKRIKGELPDGLSLQDKIGAVAKAVHDFSLFNTLDDMNVMHDTTVVEQSKGVIQLYLTVAYLFTKSMVQVNTRFSLAFSCLERDAGLRFGKFNQKKAEEYLRLTEKFVCDDSTILADYQKEKGVIKAKKLSRSQAKPLYDAINRKYKKMHFSKRVLEEMMIPNLAEAKKILPIIVNFRNSVQHLNVVNQMGEYMTDAAVDSYYGMYCYILQNILADEMIARYANDKATQRERQAVQQINEIGIKLKENLKKYRSYSKDMMWTINMPFAYNLPRYKNLSCEYLFYDKEYNQDDAQKSTC